MKRYQSAAGRRHQDEGGLSDPPVTDPHEYNDLHSQKQRRGSSEKTVNRHLSTNDSMGTKQRKNGNTEAEGGASQNDQQQNLTQDKTGTNHVKSSAETQELSGDSKPTRKARKPDREFYQPGTRRSFQGKEGGTAKEQDKLPPKTQEQKILPESSAGENQEKKKRPVHTNEGKDKEFKLNRYEPQLNSSELSRNHGTRKHSLHADVSVEKITTKVENLSMTDECNTNCLKEELTRKAKNEGNEKPEKKREKGTRKRRGGEKEKDRNRDNRRDNEVGVSENSERGKFGKEKNKRTTEVSKDHKQTKTGHAYQNKGRGEGQNVNRAAEGLERKKPSANITTPTSKRYSKSDIRRPRNRTYSSSSASSVTSLDGPRLGMDIVNTKWQHLELRHKTKEEMTVSEKGSRKPLQSWTTNGESSTESLEGSEYSDTGYDRRRKVGEKEPSADRQREERNPSRGNKGGGRGILHISLEKHSGKPSPSGQAHRGRQGSLSRGRGGGILVLPSRTDISSSPEVGQRLLFGNRGGAASRSRGGRGGGMRRLWDPNNPDQKPALTGSQSHHSSLQQPAYLQTGSGYGQLHFLDTDDEVAGSPPIQQGEHLLSKQAAAMAYYKFQNSDNPYCYPVATGNPHSPGTATGQRYPYAYPVGPYQMPPTNGMYTGPGVGQYCGGYRGAGYSQSSMGSSLTPGEMEQQARGELGRQLRAADAQELQLSNLLSRDRVSSEGLERMAHLR